MYGIAYLQCESLIQHPNRPVHRIYEVKANTNMNVLCGLMTCLYWL